MIRAAITLKLCTYEETGAIVAAMTTSIPEAPGTAAQLGLPLLLAARRVLRRARAERPVRSRRRWRTICASSSTSSDRPRRRAICSRSTASASKPRWPSASSTSLPGYRGMGPVRVGNQAYEHFQHDVYGNVVLGATQAFFDHRLLRPAGVDDFRDWSGWASGPRAARPARRRHLGAAHARRRPHLVGADVLGGVRPPGEDRARTSDWPSAASVLATAAPDAIARRSSSSRWSDEATGVRRDASAATNSTPACC